MSNEQIGAWDNQNPTPKGSPRVGPPNFSVSVTKTTKKEQSNQLPISPISNERPSTTIHVTPSSTRLSNERPSTTTTPSSTRLSNERPSTTMTPSSTKSPNQNQNHLPIPLSPKSKMAALLQAASYGSIRPNVQFVRRMTRTRRPHTVSKVTCFFREENRYPSTYYNATTPKSNKRPERDRPSTEEDQAAMMRSRSPFDLFDGEELEEEQKKGHVVQKESIKGQRLDSGLPFRQYRHPLTGMQDIRPLTRMDLTGTRESLVSNVLRNARSNKIDPILVARYDLQSGKRYVEHKNVVQRYNLSPDARRARALKREFAKPLQSLKKYYVGNKMTDEMPKIKLKDVKINMHLRDTKFGSGRRGRGRASRTGRTRRKRPMTTGGKWKKKRFQESSLMVDNRG